MSELDELKSNINQLDTHCQQMIVSGHIGSSISNTIDKLVEDSLNIIAGLEKTKAKKVTPIVPPEIKIEKTSIETKIPYKRKK